MLEGVVMGCFLGGDLVKSQHGGCEPEREMEGDAALPWCLFDEGGGRWCDLCGEG